MNRLASLFVAAGLALPLVAAAQTPTSPKVTPADQPRTQLEKEQTVDGGQATKYGGPGSNTSSTGQTAREGTAQTGKTSHSMMRKDKADTKPGDASSAPAMTKDGTTGK